MTSEQAGIIWLAATPIGNVDDASTRLRDLLETADCIAAEDTRRLGSLCARMGVTYTGELIPVHDHNESDRAAELVDRALAGQTVLLVSDAGTPTVSDPGFRVTRAAAAAGVRVSPVPGPSAALAALSVSGLPSDRFTFEGFLPRKSGEARRRLEGVASLPHTLVFFESPRRLPGTLRLLGEVLGSSRPAAVCRELTKTFEEVRRGTLMELGDYFGEETRGEITIVVGGALPVTAAGDDHVQRVLALAAQGMRLKDAAAQVAQETGLRKNELYRLALAADS